MFLYGGYPLRMRSRLNGWVVGSYKSELFTKNRKDLNIIILNNHELFKRTNLEDLHNSIWNTSNNFNHWVDIALSLPTIKPSVPLWSVVNKNV